MIEQIRPSNLAIQAKSSRIARRLSKKSFATALICILLFGVAGSLMANPVKALTSPSGIVAYIEITITNSQPVSTPSPFQQMLTVNSTTYSTYEASNLQNIEFFDSSGNIIPSWLESGNSSTATNTVYWLNLEGGISAESNLTIYMGFASISTNLLNASTTGEAPQLSPIYGEYDDGVNIFSAYWNFAGTALPSTWKLETGTSTVNNGVSISSGEISTNAKYNPQITVLDGYGFETSGAIGSTFTWGDHVPAYGFGGTGGSDYAIGNWNGESTNYDVTYNPNFAVGATPLLLSTYASGVGSYESINYNAYQSISSYYTASTSLPINLQTQQLGRGDTVFMQWIRLRLLPPNGVMPRATLQNLTVVQGPFPLLIVALISIVLLVIVVIAVLLYFRRKRAGKDSRKNDMPPSPT